MTDFDVIVVGGGPAGSVAARQAAEGGASVLMLEKDRDIGMPVRCAEGVGADGLRLFMEPIANHIQTTIDDVKLITGNGTELLFSGRELGYILNRKVFDFYLAERAALAGAEIHTGAYVNGLLFDDDRVAGVQVAIQNKTHKIKSRIVIGADGSESRVGRWAGIRTQLKLKDMESVIQYVLADVDVDPGTVYFYFAHALSPGGYVWIFPRGDWVANIGLGIAGQYSRQDSAMAYLDRFVADRFPNAKCLNTTMGCVPTAKTLKKIVAPGLMLVGDAARQVNPLSGGGIVSGMIAGRIAGGVAAEAVAANDLSESYLKRYEKLWHKEEGKNHEMFYSLKETIMRYDDDYLDEIAQTVNTMPRTGNSTMAFIKTVLRKHPRLIKDATFVFKDIIRLNLGLN